ncbi:MAG: hypothetical protein ABI175_09635, partial [Polyangiales bacterium]
CNKEMVSLEVLDDADVARVKPLLEEHVARTGSPKAREMLAGWSSIASRLVKVMPSEMRRTQSERTTLPETAGLALGDDAERSGEPRPYVPSGKWVRNGSDAPSSGAVISAPSVELAERMKEVANG